jgi:hypothetical protein
MTDVKKEMELINAKLVPMDTDLPMENVLNVPEVPLLVIPQEMLKPS